MVQQKDKPVALVSGADKGIGLQITKDLAAHGVNALVGSRNLEHGETAAKSPAKMKKYSARVSVLRTPFPVHTKPSACNLDALSQRVYAGPRKTLEVVRAHRMHWWRGSNAAKLGADAKAGRSLAEKRTQRRELPSVVSPATRHT